MADTRQQSKVVTEHEDANAAIDQLRHIAGVLKKVGDEALGLRSVDEDLAEAKADLERAHLEINELTSIGEDFERLHGAVEDLERGIIDRTELFNLAREMSRA